MARAWLPWAACALLLAAACEREVVIGHAVLGLPDAGGGFDAGADAGAGGPVDGGDATDATTPDDEDAGAPPPPPVTWPTGAHVGNELERLEAFESFRGRPLDLVMVFVDRLTGWPGLVAPAWPVDLLPADGPRVILAQPLYPEGMGDNQACAAGDYDERWRQLGPFLIARGHGDAIIRLGWGPNDVEHPWRADPDPADWIACYRRVAAAIRQGGPELEIAWDFNPAGRPDNTALDPWATYPGDEAVDYIGIEHFDRYPPSPDAASFQARCQAPTGLCSVIAFARAHGKRVGISEWGVSSCGEQLGGDNPLFVRETFERFAEHGDVMGFELYYEESTLLCSALLGDTPNPQAADEYRFLYGPR